MTEPSAERPFFETTDHVPAASRPAASRSPLMVGAIIAGVLGFALQSRSGIGPDILPHERTGAVTFIAVSLFVSALIIAGLGSVALLGSGARRYKQRTFGEDFGALLAACLLGSVGGLGLAFALGGFR